MRTLEINRRLARNHEVIALTAPYRDSREREEDGVHWIPAGPASSPRADRLTYFALMPRWLRRLDADLVVDDFGAPFGASLAPRLTRRPVIGSVQWLFAEEMSRKYRLPFRRIEQAGLRHYDQYIAVSDWLGNELRRRAPHARVHVVPNGVDADLFGIAPRPPEHLLFLGRLDERQKGTDLLVEAYAHLVAAEPGAPPLVVAGDGPDREKLLDGAGRRGLTDRIRLAGRVGTAEKADLVSRAHAVLMPSRWETFGMVAAETLALGIPLVAFDVGPLREVTGDGGATLVEPFDCEAFAAAAFEIVRAPGRREQAARSGPAWARQYTWDALAARQEEIYLSTVARGGG